MLLEKRFGEIELARQYTVNYHIQYIMNHTLNILFHEYLYALAKSIEQMQTLYKL